MLWKSNGEHKVVGHSLTWWSTEDSTHMLAAILIVLLLFTEAIDMGVLSLSIFFNSKFLQKDYI